MIAGATVVAALNEHESRELGDAATHANVREIPYGIDFSGYSPPESPSGVEGASPFILVLGPLHPRGGCVALLKALAELGPIAEAWSVVFAGRDSGEWRPMLEAAVQRKGGEGRVRFVSAPDLAAQRELLSRASLVAAPVLGVDSPVPVLQALASGVPAIATICVAPVGLNGVIRVCQPRRDDLRDALRSMLTLSEPQRRDMGARARAVGRELLDWSVTAERFATLYTDVVARPAVAGCVTHEG